MSRADVAYAVAVVVFAVWFGVGLVRRAGADAGERAVATGGEPARPARPDGRRRDRARDVDVEKIRKLIEDGRLSGREAEHYRVLETDEPPER